MKRKLRFVAYLLAACVLFNNIFSSATVKVEAAGVSEALSAWELLMTLLMSAGVNVELSDAFLHVPAGTDEEMYRAFVEQNRAAELEAAYQAIETAAAQGIANGYTTLKLSKEAWDSFKTWAQESALKGLALGIATTTAAVYGSKEDIANAIGINPESELAIYIWNNYKSDGMNGKLTIGRSLETSGLYAYHVVYGKDASYDSYDIKDITATSFVISGELYEYFRYQLKEDGMTLNSYTNRVFDRLPGQGKADFKAQGWANSTGMTMLINEDVIYKQKEIGELVSVFSADVGITDVVTPGRTMAEDGTLVGDVTIAIPQGLSVTDTLAKVKAGTLTETQALAQVGVVPVDLDAGTVIGTNISISQAILDSAGDAAIKEWQDVVLGLPEVLANVIGINDNILKKLTEWDDIVLGLPDYLAHSMASSDNLGSLLKSWEDAVLGIPSLPGVVVKGLTDALPGILSGSLQDILNGVLSLPEALVNALIKALTEAGVLSIPEILSRLLDLSMTLPKSIAQELSSVLEENKKEDEGSGSGSLNLEMPSLLNSLLLIILILLMLLRIFMHCLKFIICIFRIPASPGFLPDEMVMGLDYLKTLEITGIGLSVYDFMMGLIHIMIIFGIVQLLRKTVDHVHIPRK